MPETRNVAGNSRKKQPEKENAVSDIRDVRHHARISVTRQKNSSHAVATSMLSRVLVNHPRCHRSHRQEARSCVPADADGNARMHQVTTRKAMNKKCSKA